MQELTHDFLPGCRASITGLITRAEYNGAACMLHKKRAGGRWEVSIDGCEKGATLKEANLLLEVPAPTPTSQWLVVLGGARPRTFEITPVLELGRADAGEEHLEIPRRAVRLEVCLEPTHQAQCVRIDVVNHS